MRVLPIVGRELTKQVLLLFIQLAGRNHDDSDMLITLSVAAQARNAFAFQTEERSCLCAGWYLELHLLS